MVIENPAICLVLDFLKVVKGGPFFDDFARWKMAIFSSIFRSF